MPRQYSWRQSLNKQPCIYCGRPGGHPDHVPPKNLFVRGRQNLIRVPACQACNGGASTIDDKFRLFVGLAASRAAPELLRDSVHSLNRHPAWRADLEAGSTYRPFTNDYAVPLPTGAFEPTMQRMVRGLYWHEFGEALAPALPIETYFLSTLDGLQGYLHKMKKRTIGDGQVIYAFTKFHERATCSLWVIVFHRKVFAAGITDPIWWDDQLRATGVVRPAR